jgi:hypothetical protein
MEDNNVFGSIVLTLAYFARVCVVRNLALGILIDLSIILTAAALQLRDTLAIHHSKSLLTETAWATVGRSASGTLSGNVVA